MKVLLDGCIANQAAVELKEAGHEVEHVASWDHDPGDEEILEHAWKEKQVVLTLDKDFGELAVLRERSHAGIIRLVGLRAGELGAFGAVALATYDSELQGGAIVTVSRSHVRVRHGEQEQDG